MTERTVLKLWSVYAGSLPGSWWTRMCSLPGMGVGEDRVQGHGSVDYKEVERERYPLAFYMAGKPGLQALSVAVPSLPWVER